MMLLEGLFKTGLKIQQFIRIRQELMQNLKVYLTSRNMKNKAAIEQMKANLLKNKVPVLLSEDKPNHHSSQNYLSKSYQTKHNVSTNSKKRAISNAHNRSFQQIYDFRAEVKKIIREPHRYEKQPNQKNVEKPHFNVRTPHDNKRNSKQISQPRLYYRSQPHPALEKVGPKNARSEKKLQSIVEKRKMEVSSTKMAEQKPVLKIKSNAKWQSVNKSQDIPKYPVKKRSKSANTQSKKAEEEKKERPKQKRSTSLKKVSKAIKTSNSNQGSLKGTVNLFGTDIQLKSMFRTRKGVQIMNPNKVNQDRLYLKQNVLMSNNQNMCLYAVADGHGPLGHLVSHLIVENLHKKFDNCLRQNKSVESSLERAFHDIQSVLTKNIDFNSDFSGSTLVALVVQSSKKVTCANVGDSRAIVARQLSKTSWEVIRLSNDHKPSLDGEKKRILNQGGRIDTVYDEEGKSIGPLRVWLTKKQLQGLAMSRSLGDNISKPIGVTYEPEILQHQLTSQDKFILIASDGVWQFLSNYQILSLVIPYYKQNRLEDACEALMKEAYKSWTKEDCSVIDDITFILIFLTTTTQNSQPLAVQKIEELPPQSKIKKDTQQRKPEQKQKSSNQQDQEVKHEGEDEYADSLE